MHRRSDLPEQRLVENRADRQIAGPRLKGLDRYGPSCHPEGQSVRFDDPAWQTHPLRISLRIIKSLVRKSAGPLREAVVPYDEGRSRIGANLATAIGLRLYRYGYRDPDIDLVRRLLLPGDLFVDGGANIGFFTLVAAAAVGASGEVMAFEPAETTRRILMRNVTLNEFAWVSVRSEALDSESACRNLMVFEGDAAAFSSFSAGQGSGAGTVTQVVTRTLDEVVVGAQRDRLALVKLDLEGAEHAALVGARAILEHGRADFLIELEPDHLARQGASGHEVVDMMRAHGYGFYRAVWDRQGRLELRREKRPELRGDTPNLFATKTAARAREAGVALVE